MPLLSMDHQEIEKVADIEPPVARKSGLNNTVALSNRSIE